jgi:hypothetical protein
MARIYSVERRVVLQQPPSVVLRDIEVDVRKIAKQREIIAKLDADGHDISEALGKLANFEREHAINSELPSDREGADGQDRFAASSGSIALPSDVSGVS